MYTSDKYIKDLTVSEFAALMRHIILETQAELANPDYDADDWLDVSDETAEILRAQQKRKAEDSRELVTLEEIAGGLTVQQAADELEISPRRVNALITDGRLPATKLGNRWFIKSEDLVLVEERTPGRPRKIDPAVNT